MARIGRRWGATCGIACAVLLLAAGGLAQADEKFEKAAIYLEQNLRDKDAEIKFEAAGGSAGLASLTVTAPDGRKIIDFKAPDSKLGIRLLNLESPEPKNLAAVQADFPAGIYIFAGSTVAGVKLHSEAVLSHTLPDATSFLQPRPDQKNVPVRGLSIKWSAVKNLAAVMLIIEQEETGRELRANLPGSAIEFAVPNGFLLPGAEYTLAVGTVSSNGNKSFAEIVFTTAEKI